MPASDDGEVFLLEVNLVRYDRATDARTYVERKALRLGPEHKSQWAVGLNEALYPPLADEMLEALRQQPPLRERT